MMNNKPILKIRNINTDELKVLLENDLVILVDVREDEEISSGVIHAGVKHLALSSSDLSGELLKLFYRSIDEGKRLAINCKAGGRSMMACVKLQESLDSDQLRELSEKSDFDDLEVLNVDGGVNAWVASGHDLVKV